MTYHIAADSPISFPGLFGDWEFTASSKALNIGHGVYWYGILITLGLVLAVLLCMKQKEKYGISEDNLLDGILWGIPCGIIGARLYYIIFYLDRFRDSTGAIQWGEVFAIWDGGLAIYGTVIAVVILALCLSRRKGEKGFKFFAMTDLVVIGLFVGQILGRWGNFMNREAFGAETTAPWRMRLLTTAGTYVEVHPTFLYESLWNLLGLLLLLFVVSRARRFDGENTWFYFLWYGVGRFFIEGLRTDSLYLFDWELFGQPIRVSQALSLVMVLVSLFMLLYNLKLHPHKPEELYVNIVAARHQAAQAAAAAQTSPDSEQPAPAMVDSAPAVAGEAVSPAENALETAGTENAAPEDTSPAESATPAESASEAAKAEAAGSPAREDDRQEG